MIYLYHIFMNALYMVRTRIPSIVAIFIKHRNFGIYIVATLEEKLSKANGNRKKLTYLWFK